MAEGVPNDVYISALREEVARLNDERVALMASIDWQKQVNAALQHQIDHMASNTDHHDTDETVVADEDET